MNIVARVNGVEVANSAGNPAEIVARRNAIMSKAIEIKNAVDCGDAIGVECPVKHYFCNGVYVREIFMPAGSIVFGKIHKTEHFNEIVSGECKVITPASCKEVYHKGGDIFVSEAGVQKAVYNITDVIWRTIHVNESNTRSEEELESKIIAKCYDELPYDQLIEESKRALL